MSDDLPDPAPENIDGSKSVSYSNIIHHEIPWGQVVLGIAVVVVVLFVWVNFDLGGGSEGQEGAEADSPDNGGLA